MLRPKPGDTFYSVASQYSFEIEQRVMLPPKRKQIIVELVSQHGGCSVSELAESVDVSEVTVRRDLRELSEQGLIERSHGGALPTVNLGSQDPHDQRKIQNFEAKRAIAEVARKLIADDQVVFFDGGTTSLQVVIAAPADRPIVPVTSSLPAAIELSEKYDEVRVVGGSLRSRSMTIVGTIAENFLKQLNFDLCFLGTNALSLENGLTDPHEGEANMKRLMIENSKEVVLIADGSKLGEERFVKFGEFRDIDRFITDAVLSQPLREAFEDAGTELHEGVTQGSVDVDVEVSRVRHK
jgi:DeoR family transcriptional regulator, fructose operon transcriptional repressor